MARNKNEKLKTATGGEKSEPTSEQFWETNPANVFCELRAPVIAAGCEKRGTAPMMPEQL